MASTSSRTLRLLSLLQAHRHWSGDDLAGRLEVSIRTLRRDIDRLRDLGYPVRARRGVDGGYQLAPGAALPPLVLDDEEAVALAVGLHNAAEGGLSGIAEASVRALTKVVQVMPPRLRKRVEALQAATVSTGWGSSGPPLDPAVLVAIAQACRDTERMEFDYTAADGARTSRQVEPLRLVPVGRHWYLVAYDVERHDWRSFRLDRLTAPVGNRTQFRPRTLPADNAGAFVTERLGHSAINHSVEAVVYEQESTVRGKLGRWAEVERRDDTSCLVRMRADSLDWPAMALGTLGADFTVLSPPEFVDYLRGWATRFARSISASHQT
ncbi:MAG: YafY family transcriptional regulator [Actinomycetota bacterium]|nr:YafY family transcriptional regulator [Actinomycetota bacterium]